MLFSDDQRAGILARPITITVRRWSRPQARLGGRYRLNHDSVIVVDELDMVVPDAITEDDATRAGHVGREGLLSFLGNPAPDEVLTRISLHVESEVDARTALGERQLDDATLADLRRSMARLDALRPEPWTADVLEAISTHPGMRAAELARQFARETLAFKADVRRLKALRLTRSLEVGYELSPLGSALLHLLKRATTVSDSVADRTRT